MTDRRLRECRSLLRRGQLEPDLVGELKSVAKRMVRLRVLPPSYAPYGTWDDEAAEEVFASWYEVRLLGRGHLQLLLDRAASVGAFRRLAEHSLRQHVLNQRARSQTQNVYWRVVELLETDDSFELLRDAGRPQDRWWRRAGCEAVEWAGDERLLVAHAYALGDFAVIRYRADAKKLSPVLDASELKRFVDGLLTRAGGLTPTLIMRAFQHRFDLDAVSEKQLSEDALPSGVASDIPSDLALTDTARSTVAEFTSRQLEVLRRSEAQTVEQMAHALGCSAGTIHNEQRRIAAIIERNAEPEEREQLLNKLADLLY